LVKVVGSDGAFDAQMITGSDIASGLDIRIESGSALPTSKSARQALITDWMKMGFISPQDGLKILDTGSGNVGESSESIGPPTVSVTGVVKTQLLTKGVETVEDFGLDHQSSRDVVVTVSVGTSNDLGIGVSIHICL